MSGNIIQLNDKFIQNELKTLVKNSVEETLNALLDAEANKLVQAERYALQKALKRIPPAGRASLSGLKAVVLKM